jgi:hypothetical protein
MTFEFPLQPSVIRNACIAFTDWFVITKSYLRKEPENEDMRPFVEKIGGKWWQDTMGNIYALPELVKEIAGHFKRSLVTIGEPIMKVEDLLKRDKLFEKALKKHGRKFAKREEKKIPCFRCLRFRLQEVKSITASGKHFDQKGGANCYRERFQAIG